MDQKGHVVKGLSVMQRMQRGVRVEGTEVTTETQGQGEDVKTRSQDERDGSVALCIRV